MRPSADAEQWLPALLCQQKLAEATLLSLGVVVRQASVCCGGGRWKRPPREQWKGVGLALVERG